MTIYSDDLQKITINSLDIALDYDSDAQVPYYYQQKLLL